MFIHGFMVILVMIPMLLIGAAILPHGIAHANDKNESKEAFDPWKGIDRDGRIPRIEKPEDLPHPDRWRYIPSGRIKPGNVFQRLLVSSFIAPFIFRDDDIGAGGGVALTDIDFRHQRRQEIISAIASYTSKGQQGYKLIWKRWLRQINLPDGGVLQEERSSLRVNLGYSKTLTRKHFGIGPDSREDDESSYTDELFEFGFGIVRSFPEPGSNLVIGVAMGGEIHRLSDGKKSGKPNTGDLYPVEFSSARSSSLGIIDVTVSWDTRDSQANPYSGWVIGSNIQGIPIQKGGDAGVIFSLYGEDTFPVPWLFHSGGDVGEENPPTDVLAFRIQGDQLVGDLPFYALPSAGGSANLRGYTWGRFRDRASWIASVEYRFWVIPRGFLIPFTKTIHVERLGLAFFYDAGGVADDVGKFFTEKIRHSYGIGFRVTLERTALFRVDIGFSKEDRIIFAGFGLPF